MEARIGGMSCGNEFSLSPVGTYTQTEDALILPQSELERAASVFANWKKGL